MTKEKVSMQDVIMWSGDDSKEQVLEYLKDILNGKFSVEDARD